MSRPFYRDPLAAAWMAKYHGMEFGTGRNKRTNPRDFTDTYTNEYGCFLKNDDEKHSIHPDSLHLLEPQSGDVIQTPDRQHNIVVAFGIAAYSQPLEDARINVADYGFRIIQRNGIPFMWPEQEP